MANKYAVETAFKLIDKATEPLTKIGVKGNAIGKQLKKDFMKAQDQLATLGKTAIKAGAAIAAAGVAAAGAFAVKGIKDAIEFNTAFTKVSTVADTSKISLEELNKQIMEVSNVTGVAATELANLQYTAINSGIATADSAQFVATAVKTSKAAFTDTGVVIEGLTKVLNAYQLEASEAEKIAGQMYISTTMGNASFEQLNSAMGKVLPTAARLNVGTDELFASITALTANSVETPKAIKGIETILEKVQNPTDAVARAARRLGIDFSAAALKTKGLAGFLEDIKDKTGGSEAAIMSLFGSVDSLNAINILTSRGAETFANALGEMQNAAGAVDTAFNKVMDTPAERWSRIMNKMKNAGISLGTALLPIVEKVMAKVEIFVDKIKDFDFQPVADKVAAVFDKIWGFVNFFIKLGEVIWALRVPILAVVAAIAIYKGGMLAAALVVNGFTGAQNVLKAAQLIGCIATGNQTKAMALYKAGTMGASFQTILFAARQKAAMAVGFAGSLIKQGAAFVALQAQLIGAKIATIAYAVAQKAAAIAGHIAAAAQWALNAAMAANPIGLIIIGVIALIAIIILLVKNWDKVVAAFKVAFEAIGNFFIMIWEGIKSFFGKVVEFVKKNALNILNVILTILFFPAGVIMAVVRLIIKHWDKIKEVLGKAGEFIKGVFNKVKEGASKAWEGIKGGASKAFEGIKGAASKAGGWLKENWKTVAIGMVNPYAGGLKYLYDHNEKFKNFCDTTFNKIKDISAAVWDKMPDGVKDAFLKIKGVMDSAGEKIKGIWNGVKEFFTGLWEAIKEGPAAVFDYLKNAFFGLFDAIKEKFFGFINIIKDGWETVKGFFGGIGDKIKGVFTGPDKNENMVNQQVPPQIQQITTQTAGATANVPAFNNTRGRNNQTISAAATPASRPMTTAEQHIYRETTNRDQVDIAVRAEQGTRARVTRPPRSPNVRVAASGGNG